MPRTYDDAWVEKYARRTGEGIKAIVNSEEVGAAEGGPYKKV